MSRRHLGSFLLTLALVVPLLAACGGGGTGGATNSTGAESGATAATTSGGAAPTVATGANETAATTSAQTNTNANENASTNANSNAGGTAGAAGATAGASGDVTKLQVEDGATLTFSVSGNATEQKLYQEGVQRFNQVFPNVKVTVQPVPSDYDTTIKAGFSGGTAPDVFLLDGELMGAFGPNNLLLPLDEDMSTAGVQASDYYDPLIKLYQLDGKTYGIPKDFNPLAIFVNDAMAQQAGVDPASIKTWDDLTAAAQKMTTGEGPGKTYGMCLTPDIQRYGASMLQNGNPIIQDNKATFNQQSGVDAMTFWYNFKKAGTGATYGDMGKGWCGEAFAGKNAAMVMEGGWLIPFMADPANGATDLKYTAIPLPTPPNGKQATWLFTNAFAANAQTKYPKAAAALVLYLTGAQNEQALISSGLAQPSLKALADDPYFQQNQAAQVLVQAGQYGQLADTVLGGPVKKGDVINAINKGAMEPIFLGSQSVQDALNAAAQQVDQILSQ
jgi:multiple sugar transport system substrate-binding protein